MVVKGFERLESGIAAIVSEEVVSVRDRNPDLFGDQEAELDGDQHCANRGGGDAAVEPLLDDLSGLAAQGFLGLGGKCGQRGVGSALPGRDRGLLGRWPFVSDCRRALGDPSLADRGDDPRCQITRLRAMPMRRSQRSSHSLLGIAGHQALGDLRVDAEDDQSIHKAEPGGALGRSARADRGRAHERITVGPCGFLK